MGLFDFWKKEERFDKKFHDLHKNLEDSFTRIKNDMENFGKWVLHLEKHRTHHYSRLDNIEKRMHALERILEDLKFKQEFVQTQGLNKNKQTAVRSKQTAVRVQTAVQTAVQTGVVENLEDVLRSLTVMERVVLWTLLNTDLKLSYDDLSILLGRDKSTLRGQITNIKRKSDGLIKEFIEISGKKRFFVEENIKNEILRSLKSAKMSVQTTISKKKSKK